MEKGVLKILFVEDSERDAELLRRHLTQSGYELDSVRVETEEQFLKELNSRHWDVIISDYSLPTFNALSALFLLMTSDELDIPFIIISGTIGEDVAVEAMRLGANDYLMKDNLARLIPAIEREIGDARTRREKKAAEAARRQSLQELAEAQRLTHMGSWTWDLIADRLTWSDELFRIYGLEPSNKAPAYSELQARFIHPDDVQLVDDKLQEAFSAGNPFDISHRIVRSDGSIRYIRALGSGSTDEIGRSIRYYGTAQDVTEQREAEERQKLLMQEIESQTRRLRGVIDNVPGVVWESTVSTDGGRQTRFVSDHVEKMLGYSAEEWISTPNFGRSIIHPDDRVRADKELEVQLESPEEGRPIEYRWIAKDGTVRWVQTRAANVRDHDGKTVGLRGVTVDITERKKAETDLQASENRLRMVTDNARVGLVMVDEDHAYRFANAAYAEILGLPNADIVGQRIADVLPNEYSEQIAPRLSRAFLGERVSYELRRLLSGVERTYSVRYEPTTSQDSRNLVVVVITDITDLKQAEAAVRESEKRYRLLFESNPTPMWVYDLQSLEFLEVNDAAINHYGFSPYEFLSMKITDIRSNEEARAVLQEIDAIDSILSETKIWRHRKKDGKEISVEVTAHSLDFNGRDARLVLVNDVTDKLRLEEQLRQAQKMEAIGVLAGGIAHDFNNLLTVINGYADLLMQAADKSKYWGNLKDIREAGERAAGLTRQLLAFSRKQVLEPRVLDLNAVVTNLERMLRRIIGENIDLRTITDEDLSNVNADPGQIEQIIMNLVVNARDAMPGGGKLTIETHNVILDEAYSRRHITVKPGRYVMLAISDTGTGMNAETKERIFEPFFSTKEIGRGTGLGLSMVYGIVKQSGGNIWVYSEPGRGSTFKIYLPVVIEDVTKAAEATAEPVLSGTETILLVEDDELVRKLTSDVLRIFGYKVLTAANGAEALTACEATKEKIDLLLTDVVMPMMSGRELADQIATLIPDISILFMSGYTDNAVVHQGVLDAEANFIQKPFHTDALVTKIRYVLDSAKRND